MLLTDGHKGDIKYSKLILRNLKSDKIQTFENLEQLKKEVPVST